MAKRLFVGGLPYATTSEELAQLFAGAGTVESANVISDRYTGQSKGFGFVEMSSDEEADAAVKQFEGYEINGRKLTVNEARPMEARDNNRPQGGGDRRGGNGGGFGGGRQGRY